MDLLNKLKELSSRVNELKESIQTEEATKNAFIMPFIQIMGYDVFNPLEVVPEFTADIGIKKREKVDYAICKNGNPLILIECKHWKEDLHVHSSQLKRYYNVTKAKFGVLTNGIRYRFYTDLEAVNIMDDKPFLEFDISNVKENTVSELSKFTKEKFDVEEIISSANILKYSMALKEIITREMVEPSEDFVRLFVKQIYSGKVTKHVIKDFTDIVKKVINQIYKDTVNDRLTTALANEEEEVISTPVESKIITTEEEIEGFHIVKSIVRENLDISRVVARDKQSYFGILLDDNNRKPICRLHFNGTKKYLGIINVTESDRTEEKVQLNSLDDIYNYSNRIKLTINSYLSLEH